MCGGSVRVRVRVHVFDGEHTLLQLCGRLACLLVQSIHIGFLAQHKRADVHAHFLCLLVGGVFLYCIYVPTQARSVTKITIFFEIFLSASSYAYVLRRFVDVVGVDSYDWWPTRTAANWLQVRHSHTRTHIHAHTFTCSSLSGL